MNLKSLLFSVSILFMSACVVDDIPMVLPTQPLKIKLENSNSNSTPEAMTGKVSAYVFHENKFYKSYLDLVPTASGELSLDLPKECLIYFLSETDPIPALSTLQVGSSLETFLNITYSPAGKHTATRAPEFMSGSFVMHSGMETNQVHKIEVTRSVARFDIDFTHDAKIKLNRVVLDNASASSRLFAGTSPMSSADKCSYETTFDADAKNQIADIFRTYESSDPILVTVHGLYDGVPFVVKIEQSKIERNKAYKIVVKNVGATITGIFEVLPWGDGGTIEGLPDVSERITVNIQNSIIPENVVVDQDKNEVKIPATGANLTLAFIGGSQIEIAKIDGLNADVKITSLGEATSSGDGVVTKYSLEVAPQGNGRLSYSVILNMKYKLQQLVSEQIRIIVDQSPVQIQTTTIGGRTWMAFNARSKNLADQVYTLDGSSVEDMYNKGWTTAIGGLFQFGRLYMYTPWQSGGNNAGGGTTNAPWVATTHMPCPEGYRVPSRAELKIILPEGKKLPGTYTVNDDTIVVTLHTATTSINTPTGVGGTPRYLKYVSQTTGNTLFIPLSGHKGDKSGATSPSFGHGIFLWSNDLQNAIGGWAFGAKYWPGTADTATVETNVQLQAEGFAYVRCIKK